MNIIEPVKSPCRICNDRDSILLPLCREGDGEPFFFAVCRECRDKVPYEVIPIEVKLGEGFFYCPNMPLEFEPVFREEPKKYKRTEIKDAIP